MRGASRVLCAVSTFLEVGALTAVEVAAAGVLFVLGAAALAAVAPLLHSWEGM